MQKSKNHFYKSLFFINVLFLSALSLFANINYDKAINLARDGDIQSSLKELNRLYKKYPNDKKLLYDYITVLGWGERDKEVLKMASKVDFNDSPSYLIQTVAKSARNLKEYEKSAKLYIKGAKRFPNNEQFYIGLSLVLKDMKRYELSHRVLEKAIKKFPNNLELKFIKAALYEEQNDFFDAMRIYQKLLSNDKVKNRVVVKLVGTLRRLKMPWLAQKYIRKYPKLFDEETKYAVETDQAAFKLRWATKGYHEEGDYSYIKDALVKIDDVIKKLQKERTNLKKSKRLQNAWFDKMIALEAIGKKDEVIDIYEYLKKSGVDMPYNILNIAADAYLFVKKPKIARGILYESLRKKPQNFETKVLLFYTYSDNYDMNEAIKLAEKLDKEQLPKIWDKNHLYKIENPQKVEAALLRILSYEYSGYMNYSQKELESLVFKAPGNRWYRNALARLYYDRGWYDKAKEQFDIILGIDKKNFDAKAGNILVDIKKKRYKKAALALKNLSLKYRYKEDDIKRLKKSWLKDTKNSFFIQSSYGRNLQNSNRGGSDDYEIFAKYTAPLINYKYRPYLFSNFARSGFYARFLNNRRYGIGLIYENSDISLDAKAAYNETYISSFAPSFDLNWKADDRVSFSMGGAYFSDDTPLRAIAYGIRADSYKIGAKYRGSESFESSFEYQRMDFQDNNSRDIVSFRLFDRLVFGPYYNLDAFVYAGGMKNSGGDLVSYYNPKKDFYFSFEAKNIWNLYNFYDFYIKQIVGVEIGNHWERVYGSNMTGSLLFSQEWSLNEDFGFDFGFYRKRASYDGEIEYANILFLNINGSF